MSQLREAGIEVLEGLCQDQAVEALLPYLHQRPAIPSGNG